jgi:hypothetical protein
MGYELLLSPGICPQDRVSSPVFNCGTRVNRRDLRGTQTLSDGDHGCVGGTQREVCVLADQFGHALIVGDREVFDEQFPAHERVQELRLGLAARVALDEESDLSARVR